ncbi:MAG: hypothetical protein WC427_03590 [Candidatus Paceibacterota bacterium]
MQLPKIPDQLKIYIYPADTCKNLSEKKPDKKRVLADTLILSLFLNFGLLFLVPLFNTLLVPNLIIISILLSAFTFLSILAIEYLTCIASKFKQGKGDFFIQLGITNTALVFAFSIVLLSNILVSCSFAGEEFVYGVYLLFYIILAYLNYEKIEAVHKIKSTIPSIIYGIGVAISFGIWNTILLLLIIGIF